MKIVISSGHGKLIRGAAGSPVPPYLDEVDEARRVVNRVAELWRQVGVDVVVFHDNTSTSQNQNLETIVAAHNSAGPHDYDVSIHFNAYETTSKPMGTECLYVTQETLADEVAAAIAVAADLPNRGAKYRGDLYFLNNTREKAVLVETVFVDSTVDADHYRQHFEGICLAIAEIIGDVEIDERPPPRPERPPPERPERPPEQPPIEGALFQTRGPCSWFGGPDDTGVSPGEGLAFLYSVSDAPHLFLPEQPSGTSGLARRLNPGLFYVACRWDYSTTPKSMLANPALQALVRARGRPGGFLVWPADWGPHEDTGRVADLSPALLEALELTTDDEVEVVYPAKLSGATS